MKRDQISGTRDRASGRKAAAPSFHACVLALLALACCSGCIELTQQITIRKDGSGTMTLSYNLPDNTSIQMKAMRELNKEMMRAAGETYQPRPVDNHFDLLMDPVDKNIRDLIKKYEPQGLSLDDLRIEVLEGRKRVRIQLRFEDLAKAAQSDLFRAHWPLALTKMADSVYLLNMTNGHPGKEPELDFTDSATLKAITPILKGFKVIIRIVPPGEITSTSAAQSSKRSAVWTFDFDRNPSAFSSFQTANMNVRFRAAGLKLSETPAPTP